MMNKKTFFILFFIILVASLLRVPTIEKASLWLDEGYSLRNIISGDFWGEIKDAEGTPFLYFGFLKGWSSVFGFSEFALRIPSVVFDLLAIVVMFFLTRKLYDARTGLLVSGVMTLSPINIMLSQEARPYTLALLLAVTSTFFLVKFLKEGGKINRLFYVLFTSLMLFTHNLAIFVFVGQLIYSLKNHMKIRHLSWVLFVTGLVYSFNLPFLIGQVRHVNMSLGYTLPAKLGLPSFVGHLGFFNFVIAFVLIMAAVKIFKKFLTWLCVVALIPLFNQIAPNFFVRYTFFLTPLIYIGVVRHYDRVVLKKALVGVFLLFVGLSLTIFYGTEDRKEDWRGVALFLSEQSPLPIVLVNPHTRYPLYYYLEGKTESPIVYFDVRKLPPAPFEEFWLVDSHGESFEYDYQEQEIITFKDIKLKRIGGKNAE